MQKKFNGRRIAKKVSWSFNHDSEHIFLLLCPTKELDWIEGWENVHTLICSESGIAERSCIFTTDVPGEGHSVWIASKYSLEKRNVEYVKFLTDKDAVVHWEMTVVEKETGKCSVEVDYIITGLSEKGNAFVNEFGRNQLPALFEGLPKMIEYYMNTGKKLSLL
ncbi:MAG TPA: hypothetical protein PLE16_11300 [Spirochaetota bacterium]|jgi:hypothetical protein|nr:hypothetical protein [Spirochaetota bacterium]HOH38438.1 hypothetical protein [Spirochaetota bacterium]HPJ15484.1 hypothetical protein [Spirochaetota bacterium]HPM35167.1 hypothetical protein [Spirochaetota bacterium]HPW51084.1 hypothetical protein [Spirochaetota bacterium]